jgi:hypothetical protein
MLDSSTFDMQNHSPHSFSCPYPGLTAGSQESIYDPHSISTLYTGAKPSVYTLLFKSCIRVYARAVVEYNTASRLDIRYTHKKHQLLLYTRTPASLVLVNRQLTYPSSCT